MTTMEKKSFEWTSILQATKEKLAKILWTIGGISEGDRELALKEVLWETERLQEKLQELSGRWESAERVYKEENDLLRSLLGAEEHELRARVIALGQEGQNLRRDLLTAQGELAALRKRAGDLAESNEDLRVTLKETQQRIEDLQAEKVAEWQRLVTGFSDEQKLVQEQAAHLGRELDRVREILAQKGEELTREKQEELAALQSRLLREMEEAMHRREDLLWAEEEIFARGVAQKLRGELQAALGRLQLTLEKFHLLETESGPQTKSWEQWWRLLKVGPQEFRTGFREVSDDLRKGVQTLEEYLALTRRRAPARDELHVPDLIRERAAELYAGRLEKGALEILVPEVLPMIQGDKEILGNVLQVLLDNALEALPRAGGRVRVRADKSPDGKELWIDVADTGGGVPAGLRDRIFQPFFTTKPGRRGLGLARARRYAEWHRGRLELADSGPSGSVFRLSLPLPA
jgi:signal transduction histidine kinase